MICECEKNSVTLASATSNVSMKRSRIIERRVRIDLSKGVGVREEFTSHDQRGFDFDGNVRWYVKI